MGVPEDHRALAAELVELELRREVTGSRPIPLDDPRDAMVLFALGDPRGEDSEGIQGLRNWAAQRRRNAREKREAYSRRREELRRIHEQLAQGKDGGSSA